MIGVGLLGVLQDGAIGVPFIERGLVVIGAVGYTALTLALAGAVSLDARDVRAANASAWRPRPWLAAVLALAWPPVAGVGYLVRRHRHFGTPAGWPGWWLVVALSLATSLAGATVAAVGVVLGMPSLAVSAVGVAAAVAVGGFPVAIHQDAAYVCTRSRDWRPNPGSYLGLAFLSLLVPVLQPPLAAYYLLKRRRAIGRPGLAGPGGRS